MLGQLPDQSPKDPPELSTQLLGMVVNNPSVKTEVAKDVVKDVKRETKRQDACFGPVNDPCDLAGLRVGKHVHLAEITVGEDQGVLAREEGWEVPLYMSDGFLEAGGPVVRQVDESRDTVFQQIINGIWIRLSGILPGLREELPDFSFMID